MWTLYLLVDRYSILVYLPTYKISIEKMGRVEKNNATWDSIPVLRK